jgi:hypothetical protein
VAFGGFSKNLMEVRFEVPTAASRNMSPGLLRRVFWFFTDVSKVLAAFALMMEAGSAAETSTSARLHSARARKTPSFQLIVL